MSRNIVITGASSGIGQAAVAKAAEHGWRILATARRADRLAELAARTGCETFVADLTVQADVDGLGAAAKAFGATGLVNVAGGALGQAVIAETTVEQWQRMYEVNVLATKRVIDAILPTLRRSTDDGSYADIMTVTSIAATTPYVGGSGYNAAKAAEKALTEVLRLELQGEPIRVMEVRPGMVKTEEFSLVRFGGDRERADAVYRDVQDPLTADDVARVMVDLLALPGHISVDDITVKPVAQTHAWLVSRGKLKAK